MTNPNDQAYPTYDGAYGLTKREYFAGLMASNINFHSVDYGTVREPVGEPFAWHAQKCVEFTDALIAALNKEEGK